MKDSNYFVGRKPILEWLNNFLSLKLTKIEDTANGAVACQVIDALFPRSVLMSKVDWGAKSSYQCVDNYKVLQSAFSKLSITKSIPIEKLVQGKYQDNLEFMQWLLQFYKLNRKENIEDYKPGIRRRKCKNVNLFKPAQGDFFLDSNEKKQHKYKSQIRPVRTRVRGRSSNIGTKQKEGNKENQAVRRNKISLSKQELGAMKKENETLTAEITELKKERDNVQANAEELARELEYVEAERDEYFEKLRQAEVLLQRYCANASNVNNIVQDETAINSHGSNYDMIKTVLMTLYATPDDPDGQVAFCAFEATIETS